MFQTRVAEEIKTHILCSINPPPLPRPENRAVYEIMRNNILDTDRPQKTTWRIRLARWIPKATNTHLEYVTLNAFPRPPVVTRTRHNVFFKEIYCTVKSVKYTRLQNCSLNQFAIDVLTE